MLLLLPGNARQYQRNLLNTPNIGWLITPSNIQRLPGQVWAADNQCYSLGENFRFDIYFRFLERAKQYPERCLFATVPDTVGDAEDTQRKWRAFAPQMRLLGLPLAYVAQDGMNMLPDTEYSALFIGGTTPYKLGPVVRRLVKEAKEQGKWVHMGRVNTINRFWYAYKIGVDSVDGSCFCIAPKHIDWALRELGAIHGQAPMFAS